MRRTIGQVARISGTSVRTLRHYDAIGLLTPSARSEAGYRVYDAADLDRLRQILFYRELEFPLHEIASLLARAADPVEHLARQRDLLTAKLERLRAVADAVDIELEARRMGIALNADERFEVFGNFKPESHADEVKERWGDTDAYRESARRTATYGKADWLAIKHETDAIESGFASLLASGSSPHSADALEFAEAHRRSISKWFYDCGHDLHRCLAEMYSSDPRFTAHYDDIAPGLAQFVHDAIVANADRHGAATTTN